MNCQLARESFPELLDCRTAVPAHLEARAHLASCPDCQRDFSALSQTLNALDLLPAPQPSPRLRKDFYAMLEEEKHAAGSATPAENQKGRVPGLRRPGGSGWRWIFPPLAACALFAFGYLAGRRTAVPTPLPAETVALTSKVQRLEDQLTKMGNLVGASLLQQNQRPANDRLRTVFASATQENPTDKVINDLISALAFDPSPNVRLRALAGLAAHAETEVVSTAVLASLSREENPLVQVSMIDFLAAARDREARPALEKISANDNTDSNVRSAARRALAQL